MNTIDALEKEIELQPDFLIDIISNIQKTQSKSKTAPAGSATSKKSEDREWQDTPVYNIYKNPIPLKRQTKTIFCGTGDSYCAAKMAEVFSDLNARVMDPLDLIKNPHLASAKTVCLVSISGNTVSNVKLARLLQKGAKHTVAFTAGKKSRLAKSCSKTNLLVFPNTGIFTAGSISFLCSMFACISAVFDVKKYATVVQQKKRKTHYKTLLKKAKSSVRIKGFHLAKKNKIFLIGSFYTYPICIYGAAKFYEILGYDAHYERIEQFAHMGLFCTTKGDTIIILDSKNNHNKELVKNLKAIGLHAYIIEPPKDSVANYDTTNCLSKRTKQKRQEEKPLSQELIDAKKSAVLDQVIFYTFAVQLLPLLYAKDMKKTYCYFAEAKKTRKASSSMIY